MDHKKTGKRDVNTEYLRSFACLAVVLLHLNTWCFQTGALSESMKTVQACVNTLVRFAVPAFMLITGTYTFRNADKKNWRDFYRNAFGKIVLPTLFFSGLCVLYGVLKGLLRKKWLLVPALKGFISGRPMGHMWYMYMLIGFYIVVPVLCWIRRKMDRRIWGAAGIFCIFLSQYFFKGDLLAPLWPFCWIQYVGYFIVGDCIGEFPRQSQIVFPAVIFCISSALCMSVFSIQKIYMGIRYDFQPQNILTALFSISLYLIFRNKKEMRPSAFQQKIAGQSANIYFLHGIFINILKEILKKIEVQHLCPPLFLIIGVLIITALCYKTGVILSRFADWKRSDLHILHI